MNEWFCEKCARVWFSKEGNCCGTVVKFELELHGRSLIPKANSWNDLATNIKSKWNKHPLYKEALEEFYENGNSSSSGILSLFINKLIKDKK